MVGACHVGRIAAAVAAAITAATTPSIFLHISK
jgi:hypothetical protein